MTITTTHPVTAFARELGHTGSSFAILAEGNVSVRDGSGFLVKATGAEMHAAQDDDFVRMELSPLMELIHDARRATDAEVTRALASASDGSRRRPSVESLLHAVCYRDESVTAIAHSHPEAVLSVLCSSRPEVIAEGSMFPDQIVVLGKSPLFVPYTDPGLDLARLVERMLDEHEAALGEFPKLLYLQNHGIFALGGSVAEAMRITRMAEKCARVLAGTLGLGGPMFLSADAVHRIDTRPDEVLRRALLSRGPSHF